MALYPTFVASPYHRRRLRSVIIYFPAYTIHFPCVNATPLPRSPARSITSCIDQVVVDSHPQRSNTSSIEKVLQWEVEAIQVGPIIIV